MYMIFSFSAQTADESGQLSMLVSEKVVLLLGKLTSGNLDTAQVGVYADEIHFLVRKMAHFSEYLLLGLTADLMKCSCVRRICCQLRKKAHLFITARRLKGR